MSNLVRLNEDRYLTHHGAVDCQVTGVDERNVDFVLCSTCFPPRGSTLPPQDSVQSRSDGKAFVHVEIIKIL